MLLNVPHDVPLAYDTSYVQQSYAPQTYTPYTQTTSTYAPAQQAPVTYDPYKPAQAQPSYESAAHATDTSVKTSYDPYKPSYTAASTSQQAYTYGSDPRTSAFASPPVPVPAPSAPALVEPPPPPPATDVSKFRPKTFNAYDPPLPAVKSRHVSNPPRAVYGSPSPATPPPRNTLSPPAHPPPPKGARRTPDPHAIAAQVRRDSHPSTHHVSPMAPSSGPYALAVNGVPHPQPPQAGYVPQTNHGLPPTANGSYTYPGYAPSSRLPEGLPKVNETYAPYVPDATEEPPAAESATAMAVASSVDANDTSIFDAPSELVASPTPDPDPEAEEGTPHVPYHDPSHSAGIPEASLSPTVTTTSLATESAVHTHAAYSTPGASSPDKIVSPPRSSSTAPQFTTQPSSTVYDPYAPKSNISDRAKSPGASSIRSVASLQQQSYQPPPRRDSAANASPTLARPLSSQSRRSTYSSPYEPQAVAELKRTASPANSVHSIAASTHSAYEPYAPVQKPNGPSMTRDRATSNGSVYSTSSVSDPYAPSRHPARQSSEHAYGSFALPQPTTYAPSAPAVTYDRSGAQYVTLAAPTHSTYAPSPSLLGTNDPLGRTSARVPVISFGFGGKLITCFHGANINTGFDVALSARQSTDIKIHSLDKVIPESALDTSTAVYPGPLFSDPGSPTASLVRTGAQALKTKKAKVAKYLEDRAAEMTAGLGYHRQGTEDRSRVEARRTLVLLLKVMVENDGRLSGR